jgi:hypothetical protein
MEQTNLAERQRKEVIGCPQSPELVHQDPVDHGDEKHAAEV